MIRKLLIFIVVGFALGLIFQGRVHASNIIDVSQGSTTGQNYQIQLDSGNLTHFVYVEQIGTPWVLKYVRCKDSECGTKDVTDLDSGTILSPNFYLDPDGKSRVVYYKYNPQPTSNFDLTLVRCGNASCNSGNTVTIVKSVNCCAFDGMVNIARGSDGFPRIAYVDVVSSTGYLYFLKCPNADCTGATANTVYSVSTYVPLFPTLLVDQTTGSVYLANYLSSGAIYIRPCSNDTCTSTYGLLSPGSYGSTFGKITAAFDQNNYPIFGTVTGGAAGALSLQATRCSNVFCTAYTNYNGGQTGFLGNIKSGGIVFVDSSGYTVNNVISVYGTKNNSGTYQLTYRCLGCSGSMYSAGCSASALYTCGENSDSSFIAATFSGGSAKFVYLAYDSGGANWDTRHLNPTWYGQGTQTNNITLFEDVNGNGVKDAGESDVNFNNSYYSALKQSSFTISGGPSGSGIVQINGPGYSPQITKCCFGSTWGYTQSVTLGSGWVLTGYQKNGGAWTSFNSCTNSGSVSWTGGGSNFVMGVRKAGTTVTVNVFNDKDTDGYVDGPSVDPPFNNDFNNVVSVNYQTSLNSGSVTLDNNGVGTFTASTSCAVRFTVHTNTNYWKGTRYSSPGYAGGVAQPYSAGAAWNSDATTGNIAITSNLTVNLGINNLDFDVNRNTNITGSADPSPSPITDNSGYGTNTFFVTTSFSNGWVVGGTNVSLALTSCTVVYGPTTGCTPANFSLSNSSFNVNPVPYASSALGNDVTSYYTLVSGTISGNGMPAGKYKINFSATISAANYPTFVKNGSLNFQIIHAAWMKTTGGTVGSEEDIKMPYWSNPLATSKKDSTTADGTLTYSAPACSSASPGALTGTISLKYLLTSSCGYQYVHSRAYLGFDTTGITSNTAFVKLHLHVNSKIGGMVLSVYKKNWGPTVDVSDYSLSSSFVTQIDTTNITVPGDIDLPVPTSMINTSGWTYFELARSDGVSNNEINISLGASASNKPQLVFYSAGSVINVIVVNKGSGYSSSAPPSVSIEPPRVSGPTCAQAQATAEVPSGEVSVSRFWVTNPGGCYTFTPKVTVSGNATAVAMISANADAVAISAGATAISANFISAKGWLVSNYQNPGGKIDTHSGTTDYYQYFWNKFGSGGRAADWNPTCSTVVSGLAASSCVLLNTSNSGLGDGGLLADNGVFVYKDPGTKPDLLYNIQAALDTTYTAHTDISQTNFAGKDRSISGNPTVIFVPGKLQINHSILTTGNKKLVFIVQGNVQISPMVREIDATIITKGSFDDFIWFNPRNLTRYNHLVAIENQLKVFFKYVGYYPFAQPTDTSEGCATDTPNAGYGDTGWWYEAWHKAGDGTHGFPYGDRNWDGSTSGATPTNNFQYDACPAAPSGSAKPGLRWNLDVRTDLPAGYYTDSSSFELNNYLDPINGKICPGGCGGKIIATPKMFAYRYMSWFPDYVFCWDPADPSYNSNGYFGTCVTAYLLQAEMEDDGYRDSSETVPDNAYTLCGGDYNHSYSTNIFESNLSGTGTWSCGFWPLKVNGSVIAQNGLSLTRDLRDDNNSGYFPAHPPIPAEEFNFDPALLYWFATKAIAGNSYLGDTRASLKELAP